MIWIKAALMHFCEWCNASWFGHGIRNSTWLFPFVEIFHLLGLGVLGGTILMLNLRLLGFQFKESSPSQLARELRPWMLGSLAVMLTSGFLLFSTEAVKMDGNWAFQYKMLFLLLAVVYTLTIHRAMTMSDISRISPIWRWLAVAVSIFLWSGVGLGGRAIGYVN